ncbi:MAG: hypothetical protein ABI456_11465 [Ktedonobacteraceae bacterium]
MAKGQRNPQDSTPRTTGKEWTSSEAPFSQELFAIFGEPINLRATYHDGEWFLCLNDVIIFLTASRDPSQYWRKMRARAKSEAWEETAQEVIALPIPDQNGRLQPMNCANRRTLLRLVQGIPGEKAEKFKLLLADLGDAFFSYVEDKTSAVEKWRERWRQDGRDEEWIEARLKSDVTRNEWTNELQVRGITVDAHFAYLTNTLHTLTFEISIRDHKALKDLPARTNLQDNSTPLELLIEATSQAAATEIHRDRNSYGLPQLDQDVTDAAEVGRAARLAAERVLGRPVVSPQNYLKSKKPRNQVVDAPSSQMPQIEAQQQHGEYHQSSLFDEI